MIGNLLSRYLDGKEARELAAEHAKALKTVEALTAENAELRQAMADLRGLVGKDREYLAADLTHARKLLRESKEQAQQFEVELMQARRRIANLLESADLRRIPQPDDSVKRQAEQDRRNCVEMQDRLRAAELALETCGRED